MTRASPRASPYQATRRSDDSPSRRKEYELERAFSQVHLHHAECQKLDAFQRRQQQEELDAREKARAEVHRAEINFATAQHDLVRQQAEAVLLAYLKKEEEERRRQEEERRRKEEEEKRRQQEEEARRRAEQERKEREEKERRENEERARVEKERLAIYEKQKAEAAAEEKRRLEREATEQARREETARSEHDAAAKRQEAQNAAVAAAAAAASAIANKPREQTAPAPQHPSSETHHKHYLAMHRKLKVFRKQFWEVNRKEPALKPHVGDMRRAMKATIGQLTDDKPSNKKLQDRVRQILLRALKEIPSPPVIVNEYLPPDITLLDKNQTTVPSLVLYLLSMFSKAVINAFVGECVVNPMAAEPIGTLVAQIFSMPELQFQRHVPSSNSGVHYEAFGGTVPTPPMKPTSCSLISVLICKFHAAAPILFGISGSESTTAGKLRMGWRMQTLDDGRKAFVDEQKQYDRLVGLGVGYASIALRNFSKARISNPFPPRNFWESLAYVVNTPPSEVQPSHLILLKSMLENNAKDRFVLFFGAAGVAALKQAVVGLPASLPHKLQENQLTKTLVLMGEGWKMGWD